MERVERKMDFMNTKTVAIVIYGDKDANRNALTDDNYKGLADALSENGFHVESVLYHDSMLAQLKTELPKYGALLVWVNPNQQGNDRRPLDSLLLDVADKGVFVSTHPEIISKIGTKKVLYSTKDMDWGSDVELYADVEDFKKRFMPSLDRTSIRVLKQYRGQSGDGIFKVQLADNGDRVRYIHATSPTGGRTLSMDDFHEAFSRFFENGGILINQQWLHEIINGMVRCYITGNKVSGFGYQESVALCPQSADADSPIRPISRRFYFSEHCGLFQDLRGVMESKWIPQLQEIHSISDGAMPLLWDADFFINDVNHPSPAQKYTLCEINVSCVSPFPPSCIQHIVDALKAKLSSPTYF